MINSFTQNVGRNYINSIEAAKVISTNIQNTKQKTPSAQLLHCLLGQSHLCWTQMSR